MKPRGLGFLIALLVLAGGAAVFRAQVRRPAVAMIRTMKDQKTVADRVAQYGPAVRARLVPAFTRIGGTYPPRRITLVGLKSERVLQVWVSGAGDDWKHLKDYPILGLSGTLGPKLREGDRQVPEGLYLVESLNPNSLYHLALRLNYPNEDDRRRGTADGRTALGSDIMIHGKDCSIGCLAMGDEAAEDLFVLAAETSPGAISVILSPVDFRARAPPDPRPTAPLWTASLYASIQMELEKLRPTMAPSLGTPDIP